MKILFLGEASSLAIAQGLMHLGHEVDCPGSANKKLLQVPEACDVVIVAEDVGARLLPPGLEKEWLSAVPCLWMGGKPPLASPGHAMPIPLSASSTVETLQAILALLKVSAQQAQRNALLTKQVDHLRVAVDGEHRQARRMLEQFVHNETLSDPAIQSWTRPADIFSGDLLLAARTPAGALHIMLVDDMQKGTLAAVSTLPVVAPFYRMTEKGFGIDAIVREANSRIFRFYPEGCPVHATLVSVDFADGVIHVWNGGTPAPILLSRQHNESAEATPHAPLGSLPPAAFHVETDVWTFRDKEMLALGSGGLLRQLAPGADRAGALQAFRGWLEGYGNLQHALPEAPSMQSGGGLIARDDMSLIVVSCHRDQTSRQDRERAVEGASSVGQWKLSLSVGPDEMRSVDVVPLMLSAIAQFEAVKDMGGVLFVVLSELYNNALDHGVLGLDSSLKLGEQGMETYLDERAKRLAGLVSAQIELSLVLEQGPEGAGVVIVCRDSGKGFDYSDILNRTPSAKDDEPLPYGRGLSLVLSMARRVEFNTQGNQLRVELSLC
ncbi:MAG: hypothetical protein EKK46_02550 [Rhodocyclaceae bacterium]|nr:MAG: hypothetical protein EKK46_02550 [Rhodocyclaceae bacterium]